jgi:hypothetical protein
MVTIVNGGRSGRSSEDNMTDPGRIERARELEELAKETHQHARKTERRMAELVARLEAEVRS